MSLRTGIANNYQRLAKRTIYGGRVEPTEREKAMGSKRHLNCGKIRYQGYIYSAAIAPFR